MTQSMRLIGRHFQGVVSSRGSSPDASQDVAKVFTERARIVVADGAGDTGAAAGEWAGVLALCYGIGEGSVASSESEWLGRAVDAWNSALNISRFTVKGVSFNPQEVALFQRGVDASFIGAEFDDRIDTLFVNWVAAGDCEAFLFRGDCLHACGPICHWEDFVSTTLSLNSRTPQQVYLKRCEWELKESDVLIFCSDALGQFILKACDNGVPSEVHSLIRCTEWQDLRQHVESWRQDGRLRNDDVAIVRISIHRRQGAGPFSLTRDTGLDMRRVTALPASGDEAVSKPLVVMAPHNVSDAPAPSATPRLALDRAKVSRPVVYGLFVTFAIGLLVGSTLPINRTRTRKSPVEVAEHRLGVDQKREPVPSNPIPSLASTDQTTSEVVDTMQSEPTVRVSSMANQQQAASTVPVAEEEKERRKDVAATSNEDGKEKSTTMRFPAPIIMAKEPAHDTTIAKSLVQNEESPKLENTALVKVEPAEPVAAPSSDTVTAPRSAQVGAPSQIESSATAGATDSATEAARRDPAQTDKNTSEEEMQPRTPPPCILPKGTNLYKTAEGEVWPLLRVEASYVTCIVDESAKQDVGRLTISAWVDAGPKGADEPAWLSKGRIQQPTNVWTAPPSNRGSAPLGSLKESTLFTLGKRKLWKGHVWVEIIIPAYRSKK